MHAAFGSGRAWGRPGVWVEGSGCCACTLLRRSSLILLVACACVRQVATAWKLHGAQLEAVRAEFQTDAQSIRDILRLWQVRGLPQQPCLLSLLLSSCSSVRFWWEPGPFWWCCE